jgi:enterobactin synthetase component D
MVAANPDVVPSVARQFSVHLNASGEIDDAWLTTESIPCPPELQDATMKRRRQFCAGRICALAALHALEPEARAAAPSRGERGMPIWPAGVTGSITHTDEFVSAAVVRTRDVRGLGIDSERIMSDERARGVSPAVAWPYELAHVRRAGWSRLEALTLVFSAKESIFKCLYPLIGRFFEFHDVRIVAVDGESRTFTAHVVKTLSPDFPAGTVLTGRFEFRSGSVHTGVTVLA